MVWLLDVPAVVYLPGREINLNSLQILADNVRSVCFRLLRPNKVGLREWSSTVNSRLLIAAWHVPEYSASSENGWGRDRIVNFKKRTLGISV